MSYYKKDDTNPYSTIVSADYLSSMFQYLIRYIGVSAAEAEYLKVGADGREALALMESFANPESTWADWTGEIA